MKPFKILFIAILSFTFFQCDSDDDEGINSPIADFQFLVEGAVVTFNGKVSDDTNSYSWDFGDGNTSEEEDPVYAFAAAGDYEVSLTATSPSGTFVETKTVTILQSFEILLTGGPAKPGGKSWKLKKAYTGTEGAGVVENELSLFQPSIDNVLDAVGLGASYEDTFTFVYDGSYSVDNVDGNSLMGLVYASFERGADIREVSWDPASVPLANVAYTPEDGTWEVSEEDFSVLAINPFTQQPGMVDFTDKTKIITSEYLGIKEADGFVIIKDLTETTMSVAISIGVVEDPNYYTIPTIMLHLTLEAN